MCSTLSLLAIFEILRFLKRFMLVKYMVIKVVIHGGYKGGHVKGAWKGHEGAVIISVMIDVIFESERGETPP